MMYREKVQNPKPTTKGLKERGKGKGKRMSFLMIMCVLKGNQNHHTMH